MLWQKMISMFDLNTSTSAVHIPLIIHVSFFVLSGSSVAVKDAVSWNSNVGHVLTCYSVPRPWWFNYPGGLIYNEL